MRHRWARGVGVLTLLLAGTSGAGAQEVPRDQYLRQIPLSLPKATPAAPGNAVFDLWGAGMPGYADVAPVDGIDDRRGRRLEELARRFAPFLIQNSDNLPTRFDAYWRAEDEFLLQVDRWAVGGVEPELDGTLAVNLSALDGTPCASAGGARTFPDAATSDGATEDCKLLDLMERFTPGSNRMEPVDDRLLRSPDAEFDVLFLDFPGSGPEDWDLGYEPTWRRLDEAERARFPHTYVHPFVNDLGPEAGERRWEFVLQYWFFYPTNDSGMNHEGDWEHINVVLAPLSGVTAPLRAEDVQAILDGTVPANDPLVMQRVDFYFHEFVMPIEFGVPNAYAPRAEWTAQVEALAKTRFGESGTWEAARRLVWMDDAETRINTHPFAHIGSDNKGLNQAMELPGGTNRDAHGSYPFAGRYNNVGPGGTTDQVDTHVDHRRFLADLAAGRVTDGPVFEREAVVGFQTPGRIRILPDRERIEPLARASAEVRRDWIWFVLPIRWGYPATRSPFAGVLPHFNTGNNAPPGPSYNGGWGKVRDNAGFELYDPHRLPSLFPTQVQDNFRNDLGFLNLTLPTLLNLPPLDVVTRWVSYPIRELLGRPDPVFFPADSVPFRFVGVEAGVSFQSLSEDWDALLINPVQFDAFIVALALHPLEQGATDSTAVTGGGIEIDIQPSPFLRLPFYVGSRFVSESMIRHTRAIYRLDVEFDDIAPYAYRSELNHWEYAGSLRVNLLTGALQPYVKGGYGWSWYRMQDAVSTSGPIEPANTRWFGPENILPTTWHLGIGGEWVLRRDMGSSIGGFDLGLRVEVGRYWEDLRLDLSSIPLERLGLIFNTIADVPGGTRVSRTDLSVSFSLSF